ncbi:MAG TPA: hypothetical protein VF519_11820 [Mycobacteriales bacterium]
MRTFSKRTMFVAGSTAVVLAAAGIAYAYYAGSIAGTGTGTATPAANTSQAISFASSAISDLAPGTTKNATVTFTNPNAWAVSYPERTVSVSSVTGPAGCLTNAVAGLSGSATLPAGVLAKNGAAGSTVTVSVPVTMADSMDVDQTACAGANLVVTYAAAVPAP